VKHFVTGATGFIGSHLVPKLIGQGHAVTCLVRSPTKAEALKKLGATLAQGDVTDKASMIEPLRDVDGVFHLAGMYELGREYHDRMRAINVDGARNTFEAAIEAGVPRVVHTSTIGVFGNTHGQLPDETYRVEKSELSSEYERTKWAAHYEVALPMIQRGAPIVITQPGAVTGRGDTSPLAQIFNMFLRRMPVMFGAKSGVTWAQVDDIADGHILTMEQGRIGESYILAGPAMTYRESMQAFETISGIGAPKIWLPGWVAGATSGLFGALERTFNAKLMFSSEALNTLNDYTFYGSAEKAKRELGWQPRPVEPIFKEVLDYEMQRLKSA
jgi:nucleoside-diphosphate-sugar epimerase